MEPADSDQGLPLVHVPPAEARGASSLLAEVRRIAGLDPARCYQCGKCSAGCPMASEMALRTHQLVRLVQLDRRERLVESDSIWLCVGCETCTTRCPNGFDPAAVIDALRELVLREEPSRVPRRIGAFHSAFLDQIHSHGRLFELGLVVSFKLRSGALFDDVGSVPGLLRRGKLGFVPKRIDGIDEVRRIFVACQTEEEQR
jgi:heterodisulfide reductase subunit C